MLDWVMGFFCLLWLILILKVLWDLYFQAREVDFEMQRSKERNIALTPGREDYIRTILRNLLWFAIGAHVVSVLLIALVTFFSKGKVGYYFAGFYLVSTVFRPAATGYAYLTRKLKAIGQEVHYPREDVENLLRKLACLEGKARGAGLSDDTAIYAAVGAAPGQITHLTRQIQEQSSKTAEELRELRQRVHTVVREFETAIARLTGNQEVVKGIQAFARLVTQAIRH